MPVCKQLHILLVNNYTMRCGITKAVASLANAMAERGHKVTIYSQLSIPRSIYPLYRLGYFLYTQSLPKGKRPDFPKGTEKLQGMYPFHPKVTIRSYNFTDKNLKIQRLRQKIRNLSPDVCVCPLPDGAQLVWAVTLLGSGIPYVYSERHSPGTIENIFWNRKGRLAAMSGADVIHLLLPSFSESVPDFLRDKVRIIPNAVSISRISAKQSDQNTNCKILLWLGRMHEELKQCRMALDAFALIADRHPDWNMHIVGDGQDSRLIQNHAKRLGLNEKIRFLGEVQDVQYAYTSAHAFCFSSKTEGMPNTLLEAMSYGLPCVGFASCEGVQDIIRDGENGLIAEHMTAKALANKLDYLMGDTVLRVRLGESARACVSAFSEKQVFDAWESLLSEAASHKGQTVMDGFACEPFAAQARLSSVARREWLWRDFGGFMPDTIEGYLSLYCWKEPLRRFKEAIVNWKGR